MTDQRPTPEQIEDERDGGFTSSPSLREYDEALADHGYVIVHPDDVIVDSGWGDTRVEANAFSLGWNACRRHIFGDDT